MELSQIIPHIEALIFASEKPLTNLDLVELLNNAMGFIEDRATLDQVETAVEGIYEKYSAEFYAFELKQSGGGWQFLTKKEYHKTVAQLNGDKFLKRLSNAALETLAIIAYKQPITKSEIESIRGVNCDYAVQKLLEKDLVIIAGRNEDAVGKPLIYSTSKSFMDYFGINSTDDLPKISEVLMDELVQATIVNSAAQLEEELDETATTVLAVTEEGEIVENVTTLTNDDAGEVLIAVIEEEEVVVVEESGANIPDPTEDNAADIGIAVFEADEMDENNQELTEEEIVIAVIDEEIIEEDQEQTEDTTEETKPEVAEVESDEDKQIRDEKEQSES